MYQTRKQEISEQEYELLSADEKRFYQRNLIRQGKIYQINSLIQTGSKYGMQTMDMALMKLYEDDIISKRDLLIFLSNKDVIENMKS